MKQAGSTCDASEEWPDSHLYAPLTERQGFPMLGFSNCMALAQNTLYDLKQIVGAENVLTEAEDLIPYSFDGTAALQQMPGCVVFAKTTQETCSILKLANTTKIPVVTRGSGTGLSGGSLPSPGCIV